MEKLSKRDETRIMRALEKTADLVKSGSHPNEAVLQTVKSGEHGEFTPQMVNRIIEATNTAMQLAHLKTASGSARADTFPLAEPKAIFEDLYPKKVEPPAQKVAALALPPDYDKPESRDFMKMADAPLPKQDVPMYGPDIQIRAHRTMAIHRGLQKRAEAARSAYGQQKTKVLMLAKHAASYFRQLDHKPFADVERHVVSEYGAVGKSCMALVHQLTDGREKRAELADTPLIYDRRIYPYDLFSTLIDAAQQTVKLAAEAERAKKDEEKHEDDFVSKLKTSKKVKSSMKPPPILASEEPADGELKASAVKDGSKEVPFFTKAALDLDLSEKMIGGGTSALGFGEAKPVDTGALQKVLDPTHEAEMRAIKTKAMLHEFMTSDPIISSYDSDKVTGAFNQVSQLAPNVSQQPAVMRGVLRKILQQEGVLEPFETDQLAKLEKQMVPSVREMPAEAGYDIGRLE